MLWLAVVQAASGSEHSFFAADQDMWPEADPLTADEMVGGPFLTKATQELPEESTPQQPLHHARHPHHDKFTFPSDQLAKKKR